MPCDYRNYPKNWKDISYHVRFVRAKGFCEVEGCTRATRMLTPYHGVYRRSDRSSLRSRHKEQRPRQPTCHVPAVPPSVRRRPAQKERKRNTRAQEGAARNVRGRRTTFDITNACRTLPPYSNAVLPAVL